MTRLLVLGQPDSDLFSTMPRITPCSRQMRVQLRCPKVRLRLFIIRVPHKPELDKRVLGHLCYSLLRTYCSIKDVPLINIHSYFNMSSKSKPVLTGGCRCGHITYSSSSPPDEFTNCHCQTCRKLSGAPFLTFARFPTSAITWTSGEESLTKTAYSDLADRTHCAGCGSPISMQYKCQPDLISITAGSIDEESVNATLPKVSEHIFVEKGEKAGWYEIPDDKIPRFSRFPPRFQKKIQEVRAYLLVPNSELPSSSWDHTSTSPTLVFFQMLLI
jgi:hypothetical protein